MVLLKAYIIFPLALLFLWLYFKKDKRRNLQYFLNATIFSLAHINFSTDIDLISVFYIFVRLGIGLMLIWIVINFNIFISILAHSLHNFIIFSLQFIVLFFTPITDTPRNLSTEKIDFQIEQINPLNHSKNISIYNNKSTYTSYSLEEFLTNIKINLKENDSLDINPIFKNNKYEFILVKKDTSEIDLKLILSLLERENYLIKKHNN